MELCNYPCTGKTHFYEIEAIQIPIVYNKYGDHDPNGLLYVLKKDAERIRTGAMAIRHLRFYVLMLVIQRKSVLFTAV